MSLVRHPIDGRVHFSELKRMADCPAEYAYACQTAREVTRPMTIGAVADCIVFGNRGFAVYDLNAKGERVDNPVRRGERWEQFQAEHAGEIICNPGEYAEASGAAKAVLAHPLASSLLEGCEFQRVLQWEAFGLQCSAGLEGERGGIDAYNPSRGLLLDLKITDTTEPDALSRHAWRMLWHAQMAWYLIGLAETALEKKLVSHEIFYDRTRTSYYQAKLLCVKRSPPHTVTVLNLPSDVLEEGRKSLVRWTERLRACDRTGVFPGYSEVEVDMMIPAWEMDAGEAA